MPEGEVHARRNALIQQILVNHGGHLLINNQDRGINGYAFPEIITSAGPKQWTVDTYVEIYGRRLIAEYDDGSHDSTNHGRKDAFRDAVFEQVFGIATARFNEVDFSECHLEDEIVMDQVHWVLAGKPLLRLWNGLSLPEKLRAAMEMKVIKTK